MDIYIIYIVAILSLVGLGFILHNSRSNSTKASDYFNSLNENAIDDEQISDNVAEEKVSTIEDESVDNRESIRKEQTAQYLMLLEMHRNKQYKKQIKDDIEQIDTDEYANLNDYVLTEKIGEMIGMDSEQIISYLIEEGLIERDQNTLLLTDKGVLQGGIYKNENDNTWIEWPKDLLYKFENIKKKTFEPSEDKNEDSSNIWIVIIVIIMVYIFFFK